MTRLHRALLTAVLGSGALHCSASAEGPSAGAVGQAIVGGMEVSATDSPELYLQGPEGSCTAALVAPNLVVTARHCVARATQGQFSCTPSGDLMTNPTGAGQIGADDPPSSLSFVTNAHISTGNIGQVDAVGSMIIDSQTPTACRDDVAFVVLDRSLDLTPAPIRLNTQTQVGEAVTVLGYGLTDQLQPTALRMRAGVSIVAVGPDQPSTITQAAPLRTVETSPVTCQGDSGGPILSTATGALIAIVSLGSQVGSTGPFCNDNQLSNTIGPRLADYRSLALMAFHAAGASPINEGTGADAGPTPIEASTGDAAASDDATPDDASEDAAEEASVVDAAAQDAATHPDATGSTMPLGPVVYRASGGSCSMAPGGGGAETMGWGLALAWTAIAVGRRRR